MKVLIIYLIFFLHIGRELLLSFISCCLRILQHTMQITSDFQAYLELVETRLYPAIQPDPTNDIKYAYCALGH